MLLESCVLMRVSRLLELIAEDSALEDTIYHLGRALQSESAELDLDKFLKVCPFLMFLPVFHTDVIILASERVGNKTI